MSDQRADRATPTTRLEDCGAHHAYPELHHCSECERAYCGRASIADLTKSEGLIVERP